MEGLIPQIFPYLVGLVTLVLIWLAARFLKINISEAMLRPIIAAIMAAILKVEEEAKKHGFHGEQKKDLAVTILENELDRKQKSLVNRAFGSLGRAVEYVFQEKIQPNLIRRVTGLFQKR